MYYLTLFIRTISADKSRMSTQCIYATFNCNFMTDVTGWLLHNDFYKL